jgi:predicted nucleotidyltransferase
LHQGPVELRSLVSQAWESLKSVEELLKSGVASGFHEAALRWYLYSLHQNILDALASLLAEAGLRKPASYSELAAPLLERGYAPGWFAEEVAKVARTRNLLAHAYRRIPREELADVARKALAAAPRLLEELSRMAESLGVDPPLGSERVTGVLKRHPSVLAALLFGSRARGSPAEGSDFDIAILAEQPLTLEELEGIAAELAAALGVPADKVDVVDLQAAPNELLYKVIRDGELLYASDEERFREWLRRSYVRVLDEEECFKETYYARLLRRIREAARRSAPTCDSSNPL